MMDAIGREEIGAFVDGELALARHVEIERAAQDDAQLAAEIAFVRSLKDLVRERGSYHAAPDPLRQRLAVLGSQVAPVTATARSASRRWWAWQPMAASLAAALVVIVGSQAYLARGRDESRLVDEVVASHVRAALGQRLVDVASSDHHTVKPWLSSKLDFSPPVRDAQIGSATFVGGRVDYLDGRPVAALVYRQGPHLVDDFIRPSASSDSHVVFTSDRGFQIAHWTRDGMNHWMISDVNRVEFMNLVNLIATPEAAS